MTFTRRNVVQSQLNHQKDLSIDVASTEISGKITAHNDKASRKPYVVGWTSAQQVYLDKVWSKHN
jgi:hypothetical protein